MIRKPTVTCVVRLERRAKGRRRLETGPPPPAPPVAAGRLPRVARLMALALRFEELVRTGAVADQAELARLGHVTRARVTQVMNLLLLAPDIQEDLLFLPPIVRGRDPLPLRQLNAICLTPCWVRQRNLWAERKKNLAADRPGA